MTNCNLHPVVPSRRRWYHLTPGGLVLALLAVEAMLWFSHRFRWFSSYERRGWAVLVAVASVCLVLFAMLFWCTVATLVCRRFRFNLRSVFLLVVAVALPCSWLSIEMKTAADQKAAVKAIQSVGGAVEYDHEAASRPLGPEWLCRLFGEDFLAYAIRVDYPSINCGLEVRALRGTNPELFPTASQISEYFKSLQQLRAVRIEGSVDEAGLGNIGRLTQLRELDLSGTDVTDAALRHLEGLTQLEELHLDYTRIAGSGISHLKRMTHLRSLSLNHTMLADAGLIHVKGLSCLESLALQQTMVTDAGIEQLQGLSLLRELHLYGTHVSDAGLLYLKSLRQLQTLDLVDTKVTDVGVEQLKEMARLERVGLRGTQVTNDGLNRLKLALPNCDVSM